MPYIHPALRWNCLLRNVRREPIPAAAVSCKGQCVIWEGVTSPSVEQTTRCSKRLTCQTPGHSHFGEFWMAADPQIAMALQGSPFTCVAGYLHPALCSLAVARVARGAGTRAQCYRRWRSGHAAPPRPAPVLGDWAGMCPATGCRGTLVPRWLLQLLVLQSGSNCICVLVNKW